MHYLHIDLKEKDYKQLNLNEEFNITQILKNLKYLYENEFLKMLNEIMNLNLKDLNFIFEAKV